MPPAKRKSKNALPDPKQPLLFEKEKAKKEVRYTYGPNKKYDIWKHLRDFDPWKHGYIWKKGYMWYRRPDGVDVRAYAEVNELTDEGELRPLC